MKNINKKILKKVYQTKKKQKNLLILTKINKEKLNFSSNKMIIVQKAILYKNLKAKKKES